MRSQRPILLEGGRVIDPSQQLDRVTNVLLEDGRVAAYDAIATGREEVLDVSGKIVSPGLIDMHVHLREPGREEDETIFTGTAAAIAGGFTSIACIPNTEPPLDTQASVEFIQHQAARADHCNVYVVACVSKNREGKELAELGQLIQAGAVAFSDDGAPVYDAELMRRALEYCAMFNKPILNHAEVRELTQDGVMHEGIVSLVLGLSGMPAVAEDVMTGRDIALADATGGRIHIMHVSSAGSVDLIRRAKGRGVRVTTEVCPHHFSLTDESLRTFDSNYKMSPPLRGKEHVESCIAGLRDGTIDVICTDHAPHAVEKKMRELDQAPFGIVGLETALGLVVTKLIEPGHLDWPAAIAKLTINPARILGIDKGTLRIGADADVTVIDPQVRWTVDPTTFRSKSSNTPFAGWRLQGRADTVIVGGRVKYRAELQAGEPDARRPVRAR
ncbi:MAG TPA: dihydroorotase [Pirellulales bacterium]|nr:dihydroorotase [Pirellulales bacterium]